MGKRVLHATACNRYCCTALSHIVVACTLCHIAVLLMLHARAFSSEFIFVFPPCVRPQYLFVICCMRSVRRRRRRRRTDCELLFAHLSLVRYADDRPSSGNTYFMLLCLLCTLCGNGISWSHRRSCASARVECVRLVVCCARDGRPAGKIYRKILN